MRSDSLLYRLRDDPASFLAEQTLTFLECFIAGYKSARDRPDPSLRSLEPFQRWIADKFGLDPHKAYSFGVIRAVSDDDRQAFDIWYRLWDEFQDTEALPDDGSEVPPVASDYPTETKLLDLIERRPALYIGYPSVTRLRAFLDGARLALREAGRTVTGALDFDGFRLWLIRETQLPASCKWHRILLFLNPGEAEAFAEFFRLWRLYRRQA